MSDLYTCYGCGYCGPDVDFADDEECCPDCGTLAGEGFGFAENDPADPLYQRVTP